MTLSASDVSFAYGRGAPVLRNVTLDIAAGEIVALSGPSGAGKSTLGRILAGYIEPRSGRISIDGHTRDDKGGCNPVQLVHQTAELAFNPRWSVGLSVGEGGQLNAKTCNALGIRASWLGRYPHELSGGQLQRLAIARALAADLRYLVADEITGMLDAISQAQIWRCLRAMAKERGTGILLITHDALLAQALGARCVTLDKGACLPVSTIPVNQRVIAEVSTCAE